MINQTGQFYPGGSTAVGMTVAYRLDLIRKYIDVCGAWLDCGCADGGYTVALREAGASAAIGIDREGDRVTSASRGRAKVCRGLAYARAVGEELPFKDQVFDGVLLNEVLEHVASEVETLGQIYRVLRPGGHIVVMSPNRFFPFEGHGLHMGPILIHGPVPLVHWLPRQIGTRYMRARNYWPWELRDLVARAGFEVVATSTAMPTFDVYPWLPQGVIRTYQQSLPRLAQLPIVRGLGVSTFVLGRKPS